MWIVKEIETAKGKEGCHKLWYLNDDKFSYPEGISFSAFFFGLKKRNWNGSLLYHGQHESDWKIGEKCWKKTAKKHGIKLEEPEVFRLDSLWEFYKQIGYDYKTKKYHR
jgi:hypothetical protein